MTRAPENETPRLGWTAIRVLLIAAATGWCLWPAARGGWLWDDDLEILHNPLVLAPSGWWRAWVSPAGLDYLPLKDTFNWIQWRLWGDAISGYHFTSVTLHVLSACLLWRLLDKLGVRLAWLGGLLFAIHPVAVESVAWIAEFKNTVSLPFALLATSAFIDYDQDRRPRDFGLALGCFAAAMLCKTSCAMLPFVFLLLAWWRRERIGGRELRAAAPFFGVSLVLGWVTLWFQLHRAMGAAPLTALSERFAQAGWSTLVYVRAAVFPAGLSPIYSPIHTVVPAVVAWLAIGGFFVAAWSWRQSWGRHALLGGGWFFLNLVPALGVIPMSYLRVAPRADHFLYLSLAGFAGLASAAFGVSWDRARRRQDPGRGALYLGLAATMIIAPLALVARSQATIFRTPEALWAAAAARAPGAWMGHANLGRVLLRSGRLGAARAELTEAVHLRPDSAEAHVDLGDALGQLGQSEAARREFEVAVKLDPRFAGAHYNLGRALLEGGDPAGAAAELHAAVTLDPGYAVAHNNLGLARARLGDWPQAIAEYREAVRLDPPLPEAHLNLGNVWFRMNRIDDAIAEYRLALRANPKYGAAHRNLSVALRAAGRIEEARAELAAADQP